MSILGMVGNGATSFAPTLTFKGPLGTTGTVTLPNDIHVQGNIATGAGPGIDIERGQNLAFDLGDVNPNPPVSIGPAAGPGITFSQPMATTLATGNPPDPIINLANQLAIATPARSFDAPLNPPLPAPSSCVARSPAAPPSPPTAIRPAPATASTFPPSATPTSPSSSSPAIPPPISPTAISMSGPCRKPCSPIPTPP